MSIALVRMKTYFLLTFIFADIQQLETHARNRKQREQETRDPMIEQLQQMMDNFQSSTDQLANSITANIWAEIQHQIQMMVGKYVSKQSLIGHSVSLLCLESGVQLSVLICLSQYHCPLQTHLHAINTDSQQHGLLQ